MMLWPTRGGAAEGGSNRESALAYRSWQGMPISLLRQAVVVNGTIIALHLESLKGSDSTHHKHRQKGKWDRKIAESNYSPQRQDAIPRRSRSRHQNLNALHQPISPQSPASLRLCPPTWFLRFQFRSGIFPRAPQHLRAQILHNHKAVSLRHISRAISPQHCINFTPIRTHSLP